MQQSDLKNKRIAAAMAVSISIAVPAEGLRRWAYNDSGGILTVCAGHTGTDVIKGKKYSLEECDRFLDEDMKRAINAVERCIPGLPVNVLAAFSDAVFNMGPTIACDKKNSTAARYLAGGKLIDACNQLPRWNKSKVMGVFIELPGLTKRRAAERDLCMRGLM